MKRKYFIYFSLIFCILGIMISCNQLADKSKSENSDADKTNTLQPDKSNNQGNEKKLQSIKISTLPDKLDYFIGEQIDFSGLKLSGLYNDKTTSLLPLDKCTIEPINMFKIGAQDVVIKIDEISTSFQINVSYKANNLSAVYIETDDKKPIASKEDYIDASMKIIVRGG